jgi:hypothetical protein
MKMVQCAMIIRHVGLSINWLRDTRYIKGVSNGIVEIGYIPGLSSHLACLSLSLTILLSRSSNKLLPQPG